MANQDISAAFQASLSKFNAGKSANSATASTSAGGGLFGSLFGSGGGSASLESPAVSGTGSGAMDSLLGGVRSATQNITSTLGIASRERAEPEFCGLTAWQRFVGFAATFAMASFCFMVALFSLPLMILSPSKFVTPFTLGSLLAICSFALIKGPRAYIKDCLSKERMAWTFMYFGSLSLTLYFSLFLKSYLLTIVSVVIQMFTLLKFFGSYAPTMPGLSMFSMFGGPSISLPV